MIMHQVWNDIFAVQLKIYLSDILNQYNIEKTFNRFSLQNNL